MILLCSLLLVLGAYHCCCSLYNVPLAVGGLETVEIVQASVAVAVDM